MVVLLFALTGNVISAACSNDIGVSGPMKKPARDHARRTSQAEAWRAVAKTPRAEMAVSQEKPCWSST